MSTKWLRNDGHLFLRDEPKQRTQHQDVANLACWCPSLEMQLGHFGLVLKVFGFIVIGMSRKVLPWEVPQGGCQLIGPPLMASSQLMGSIFNSSLPTFVGPHPRYQAESSEIVLRLVIVKRLTNQSWTLYYNMNSQKPSGRRTRKGSCNSLGTRTNAAVRTATSPKSGPSEGDNLTKRRGDATKPIDLRPFRRGREQV